MTAVQNWALALPVALAPLYFLCDDAVPFRGEMAAVALLSVLSFVVTSQLIPKMATRLVEKGRFGKDLCKKGTKEGEKKVAESLGIVAVLVYVVAFVMSGFLFPLRGESAFLMALNAALLSSTLMAFLGFVDDFLDVPWRIKMVAPCVGSLPLLLTYYLMSDLTVVVVPLPFRAVLGHTIDLGLLYYLYMLMLAVFLSNAVNILAGVNGVEAGQSAVIAAACLVHNLLVLRDPRSDDTLRRQHLLSVFVLAPFLAVSFGLLRHNFFPARVFVGDTYTTFAGMTLAVAAILGHYSKTLMLFCVPQVVNFVMSLPQLFRLFGYTCPRHRIPSFNARTGRLESSRNLTLLNLTLELLGSMSERALVLNVLGFQVACCVAGLVVRHVVADSFF